MTDKSPYLEKDKEITISKGDKLPHWHQDGKIQYVTFRLADSLPQAKIAELKNIIESFKTNHPQPWDADTTAEYHKVKSPLYEKLLDNGYGKCILKNPAIRTIIKDAIMFYDNECYEVIAYVIMPNHIHLLIKMIGDNSLSPLIQSIKQFSARQINIMLNRTGRVWMKRYFDRIVRSGRNLNYYINYIKENPKFIKTGEYSLYVKNSVSCD